MENQAGRIELILGPMFSGKSTALVLRIRRLIVAEKKCIVLKYKNDVRYSESEMSTHDKTMIAALPCSTLEEVWSQIQSYDIIGIDEG
jgi:thymidine kinase